MEQQRENVSQIGDRGKPGRFRPPRARDVERVQRFKIDSALKGDGASWAQAEQHKDEGDALLAKARPRRRQGRQKDSPVDPPSTVPTPPKDELLYEGVGMGSTPNRLQAGQNLDFAGYPQVVKETYELYCSQDPGLGRTMPYCMWQHVFAELLTAAILSGLKKTSDPRMAFHSDPLQAGQFSEVYVPLPIAEYIKGVTDTLTPAGEMIAVNLPVTAFPQPPIPARNGFAAIGSGSFGVANAARHNAYECYMSPYITRRLIERTLEVNEAVLSNNPTNVQRLAYAARFGAWNPLPNGYSPAGAMPTLNLLGYDEPVRLRPETINIVKKCQFENSSTILGRLAHCAEAVSAVSSVVQKQKKIKCLQFNNVKTVPTPATLVVKLRTIAQSSKQFLGKPPATLKSPYSFGASVANKAHIFGYKRIRSESAPGLCYLTGVNPIDGWIATRNDNYEMTGEFGAAGQLNDRPVVRILDHKEVILVGDVDQTLRQWMYRHSLAPDRPI